MSEENKKEKLPEPEDVRIEFILNYVMKSMRIKIEKWSKLMSTTEYKIIILDWLNNIQRRTLIISINLFGFLLPTLGFPSNSKGKSCYFIKKELIALTEDNLRDTILFGDLSINPINDFSILLNDIFYPLISNVENQREWPIEIYQDMNNQMYELKNRVAEIKGHMKNEIILPLPMNIDEIIEIGNQFENGNPIECDLNVKNALEGIVIKWSYQINDILVNNPLNLFKENSHPLPINLYKFWNLRHLNLENIFQQLSTPKIKLIGHILETINSVYYSSFETSFKATVKSLNESRNIVIYLNALQRFTETFESNDFIETYHLIKPLLHCIGLMWANSLYYCTNEHWQTLFKIISNLMIYESIKYLDSSTMFQSDPDEQLYKINDTINLLTYFRKESINLHKNLKSFQIPETNPILWSFDQTIIFERFDLFMIRLNDIKLMFETTTEFLKLERIEIGGLKGRNLSRRLSDIYVDYQKLYSKWNSIKFDPLNLNTFDSYEFDKLKLNYQHKSDSIERKLAQVLIEAFEDCYNVEDCIKFIEMFGTLLHRPIVDIEMKNKYNKIVDYYTDELELIENCYLNCYQKYIDNGLMCVSKNFSTPPIIDTLKWIKILCQRINNPLQELPYIEIPVFENNEKGILAIKRKGDLLQKLTEFEYKILFDWCANISNIITTNMHKFLLNRNLQNLLELNFGDDLEMSCKEIKLIKMFDYENLPEIVDEIYDLLDRLWKTKIMLSRITEWYNYIRVNAETCEYQMIANEIIIIDKKLCDTIDSSCWSNYDQQYIEDVYNIIGSLYKRIIKTRENIQIILKNIKTWGSIPLYERNSNNNKNNNNNNNNNNGKQLQSKKILNIIDRKIRIDQRSQDISKTNDLIKNIMLENYCLFFDLSTECHGESTTPTDINADPAKETSKTYDEHKILFNEYEKYIDGLVSEALLTSITLSIAYIKDEMEKSNGLPLFEVRLLLKESYYIFIPSFMENDKNSFITLIDNILQDICNMADQLPRIINDNNSVLSSNKNITTYKMQIDENLIINDMKNTILKNVNETINEVIEYVKIFDKFNYIWMDDKEMSLNEFLKSNNESVGQDSKDNFPNLLIFREQIDKWITIYEEIDTFETAHIFRNWLFIDMHEFKQEILNHCCKWGNTFKNYLIDYIILSLNELETFIVNGLQTLSINVQSNDFISLLKVMAVLNEIKERQLETDRIFDPLKDIADMLRQYNVEIPENIAIQFAKLPDNWQRMNSIAIQVKQKIAPIQCYQVDLIIKRIILFDKRMELYRLNFKTMKFFIVPCLKPYDECDKIEKYIKQLEEHCMQLKNSALLFELTQPTTQHLLELCRKETTLIKQLWDFVNVVDSCVNDWKKTAWRKLDVEEVEQQCKQFRKEIRTLGKTMRMWEPFLYVERLLKNLITSLRAITELQNHAIRDRHWIDLMKTTGVKIRMDTSTTLRDLLNLNLHDFEDDVKNIVDKAVKEMLMEKLLNEIHDTWTQMNFEYELHERSQLNLLKVSEYIIETLEDNQVQVQNMTNSKYIDFFKKEVMEWIVKLGNADQVINIWMEIQRKWIYLESIFTESDDIRKQLPNDAYRFDNIDIEFRNVLNVMSVLSKNVIEITNQLDLYDKMEQILNDLILCEKALNDYLETKRLEYPRFYFISSSDLLDILSNGNNPDAVGKHLSKLYDSIMRLKYKQGTKLAIGMYSKEYDEYVELQMVCDCNGKVEDWLNRVTTAMRFTLHKLFSISVNAYMEKPRDQWVFDWPAQTALCITQIWWTADVNEAFNKFEEGYENALKDYQRKQIIQLNSLISLLLGELSDGDRQKIMTICTIDVHSRDVVAKMILQKVENSNAFQWQSQLRHRWDQHLNDCFATICDAEFRYDYEYLGNTPRLVITPLTDRCYITLTQSLHLVMGGAPAGPAGTGKTETTKDLGKGLGIMVYVFNCSEQMDYRSCGNIYKGLAQTGAWGCFDEFNRISIEVLSVVAVQVKCIQDAIKSKKTSFTFMGEKIRLVPTVGLFITMNPGYAGRTELPENLKALFRPCAMVVPDFALICEIMLVAEGFQEARILARKFITLYTLCKELLSNQDHYDWGLRAIKSVLVVAGTLRRSDRQRPEDQVLMRALRDFNIPKIVTNDIPVFMGLIGDLFPLLDVPRKRSLDFEKLIKKSAIELKLQPEDAFVLKVVQLEEILAVRHSVFIVGGAGTGKTQIWKTLNRTYFNLKQKPHFNDLNPKGVTNDELYGIINPATREWKDGLFSFIMREQANLPGDGPKWIILDGDIDPMWIESLNTVMDDNKVLTLASNERIALTKQMRLIFEISHLRSATPATVSRAGILYINATDLGWYPYVASWIDNRTNSIERSNLSLLFDKYMPSLMECNRKFKKITPIADISMIQMTCYLLECILDPNDINCTKELYEMYFVFAIIWGFGSALFTDHVIDWRQEFNRFWLNEFKAIEFPHDDCIFNYYIDPKLKEFRSWETLIPEFEFDSDIPLQSTLVPTIESVRLRWFLDTLIEKKHPVMLIGVSGSGKSVIIGEKLTTLSDNYAITNIPFNFYTTSEMLQKILERPLEKKAGRNYGPSGTKQMIYFIDDMNMPEVDKFGTVQPHQIIRQFMDYRHWYDRSKLTLRDIHNCQFAASMNPTAGSFTIDSRLQRHFCSFAVSCPSGQQLCHIYDTILTHHLTSPSHKFSVQHQKLCGSLVNMGLMLHSRVAQTFLPTAIKFHYVFNLRDLANIYQGMLFATKDTCPEPSDLAKLYIHEAYRVYGDKLVDEIDQDTFKKLIRDVIKKGVEELDDQRVLKEPFLYCHFADGFGEPKYMPVKSWSHLTGLLTEAQNGYNEIIGYINLVLFEDAMSHICRINRIIEGPRGNALLIGVGGSGKQSLARLAAYISTLSVSQIQLRRGYNMSDMKNDLNLLYMKVGVKNIPSMFLITDAHITEESFLVLINDMLASGEIPELFNDDEIESIINAVRNEVKQQGIIDTKENCWKYFIEKVRRMLKIVLCFSPVGSTLRRRARKFPALVNCTAINWFHEWPRSALESVSKQFLSEIPALPEDIIESVAEFMAYVLGSVNEMSQIYLVNERRFNYTTPKSFLELIELYRKLLTDKTKDTWQRIKRLENGLVRLAQCAEKVDSLKYVLADQEVALIAKNEAADKLIIIVSAENEKVQKEKHFVAEEERKVRIIEEDVSIKTKLCEEDLRKAEPALIAAQEALNTLNKNNLTELKSFGTPPQAVINVCAAVLVLFSTRKLPKDRSWKACKQMMGAVDKFLNKLLKFDKEHIPSKVIAAIQPYLNDPEFEPNKILAKSVAASGLCEWVINIHKFYNVYLIVGPKQKALKDAQNELKEAQDKLENFKTKILDIENQLSIIQEEFDAALAEKIRFQEEANKTAFTIDLAHRLVNGLGSEAIRWHQSVDNLKNLINNLPGDVLLISCFISYVGSFSRHYRIDLLEKMWKPTFRELRPEIPHTEGVDPLDLICDDAQVAAWNNEGLPNDRMSTENATILINSTRWPLIIDPQLQGVKWIKQKYGKQLIIVQTTQKGYLDIIEKAISNGDTVLVENLDETIDPVLNPLLSRSFIKRGKAIRIGDKEVDYNEKFRLILQTKLANPHYKPEMQAQTTLINFTVTKDGLEEQLLAEVVKAERPDLEQSKSNITTQQNTFKITLKLLEDDLLVRLASAGENVLDDPTLVLNLEKTKKTAAEIENKVCEARATSIEIDRARDHYRMAAERSSILYFILNDLFKINPMYQFSLKAFIVVFKRAIKTTPTSENVKDRVDALIDAITYAVFMYTCRSLFEKDKLIFMAQMVLQIFLNSDQIDPLELDFLLRFPYISSAISPFDFLSNKLWGGIKTLTNLDSFRGIDKDIEQYTKRWKLFIESESPEKEKLPGEWKNKTSIQKLCIMRAVRPDRMIYAVLCFVEEIMGSKYIESRMIAFRESYNESNSMTPIFFILSPGVDPLTDVEKLGKQLGYSTDHGNFHNVSLGQGQESVAEHAIDIATTDGHWVILQNIHLVAKWLYRLEKKIDDTSEFTHSNFRLFISAEPAPSPAFHIIPQGILESAIKITNEPPTGMYANLHKALDNFTQETLELCTKEAEFKGILFALCYFHAVVAERRKFGPQGWNVIYPFNIGDLNISVYVLYNYLEANKGIPWEDLRYLFGEIMYGGHITDDWDRRLCRTYLEEFMQPDLIDGDLLLCQNFPAPSNSDYLGYHQYIDEILPPESPLLYGMHSNAEIGFLTHLSDELFKTIFDLQPRGALPSITGPGVGITGINTREEILKLMIEEFQDKLPEEFNMEDILSRIEERTPFVIVAVQECERINLLIMEIRRSLKELMLGLRGELTITGEMEILDESLQYDKVPVTWTKLAYPSLLGLQSWFANLLLRQKELDAWTSDFNLPASVWLAGFFNPQSFLTAIMQTTARKNEWPLDKMCLSTDVTGKEKDDFSDPPREGAYIHGLYMEGARWDSTINAIGLSRLKELYPHMPVIFLRAITQDKQDIKNIYECPVYRTRKRGSTYIWTFNLKTKEKPSKWILGGVALLLQT